MAKGFLGIILHAHLPYVRHPEHDSFFEENWLFEAITECYIPLLGVFDRLLRERINYRLTLSLSPTLISMLKDELLQQRYLRHLHRLIELSEKEIVRTRKNPELHCLARLYRRSYLAALSTFQDNYQCDLLTGFIGHQAKGRLELITCAATHGFLPLLSNSETAVRTQINVGIATYRKYIGHSPRGFWLPECGYYPGVEKLLKAAGVDYFFVDSHSVTNASVVPKHGVFAPLDCGNGVCAFARDPESSEQVWSSKLGYPGDYDYREYYRDIGYDLDLDYMSPYLLEGKIRVNTGIKYYRITGGTSDKLFYRPRKAITKARMHAQDFIENRQRQVDALAAGGMNREPMIVAPYDAELFGHWWFEGPSWLEQVLRLSAEPTNGISTLSCSDYLAANPAKQVALPSASTWGDQGYNSFWINETNDWIYPIVHKAGKLMEKFVMELQGVAVSRQQERALNQAVRSILLAQASDWPFIMKTGTTVEYATKRLTDHLARFNYLYESVRKGEIDERYLTALEVMDNIFPDIDFRSYRSD